MQFDPFAIQNPSIGSHLYLQVPISMAFGRCVELENDDTSACSEPALSQSRASSALQQTMFSSLCPHAGSRNNWSPCRLSGSFSSCCSLSNVHTEHHTSISSSAVSDIPIKKEIKSETEPMWIASPARCHVSPITSSSSTSMCSAGPVETKAYSPPFGNHYSRSYSLAEPHVDSVSPSAGSASSNSLAFRRERLHCMSQDRSNVAHSQGSDTSTSWEKNIMQGIAPEQVSPNNQPLISTLGRPRQHHYGSEWSEQDHVPLGMNRVQPKKSPGSSNNTSSIIWSENSSYAGSSEDGFHGTNEEAAALSSSSQNESPIPTTTTTTTTQPESSHPSVGPKADLSGPDQFLLRGRNSGMTYKEIKLWGSFTEAESTLRGRFRALTKAKSERLRRPVWTPKDIRLLRKIVRHMRADAGNQGKIPWKKVGETILAHGGSYHFAPSTCKKKWLEQAING